MYKRLEQLFFKPVGVAPLVTFKLVFGLLMVFSAARFMYLGWIEDHYIQPIFHFKYWGFEWVEVASAPVLYGIHFLMIFSGLGIAFFTGWLYRISAIALFLCFTYTELIDLTYYLNHYYFVSLCCLLLCVLPSQHSVLKGNLESTIPRWAILVIQAQLAYVYLYAGIAKINYEWLINAMPLKIWLPAQENLPLIGGLFSWSVTPYLFSWIGMIYDCSVVFFLLNAKTRIYAYLAVVIFHTLTGILFQIGVFPLVMIGSTLIFFSEAWHLKLLSGLRNFVNLNEGKNSSAEARGIFSTTTLKNKILFNGLLLFFAFQILFPFRYLLYTGNPFWTEQGYRYGWRVMLMEKAGTATFYVKDTKTGREGVVVNSEFLNPHQEKQMAFQPDMILQFAHFLGKHYADKMVNEPEVRAEVYVTLNGKPSQLLIDPTVNLMKERDTFAPKTWILPYQPSTAIAKND